MTRSTEQLAADTIRVLSMDAIQKARSGHPGMPMGMADIAVVLWSKYLEVDPSDPTWKDRDRFVLSNGHGSMLLYSLLHLSGFGIFRWTRSRTSANGATRRRVIPRSIRRSGSRPPPGPSVRASEPRSAWRSPRSTCGADPRRTGLVEPQHLRVLRGRRSHGGRIRRGGLARRTPRTGEADRLLRRQLNHDRRIHRSRLQRGRP